MTKRYEPTGRTYQRRDKFRGVVTEEFMHEVTIDRNKYQPLEEDKKHGLRS